MAIGTTALTASIGEDALITFTSSPTMTITGWAMTFSLRGYSGVLVSKTVGSGIAITDGSNGVYTVTLLAADTSSLKPGVYLYDVWRTDSGSNYPLASSTLTLETSAKNG